MPRPREQAPDVPAWATNQRQLFTAEQLGEPPTGTVWVEWTGESSPMDNPLVVYYLITGKITGEDAEVIREAAKMRIARVEGFTHRTIRGGNGYGELANCTEKIMVWGPNAKAKPGQIGSYVQALTFADADRLKSSDAGHEFRIYYERDGNPLTNIALPAGTISLAREEMFSSLPEFSRAMGWR